MTSSNWAFGTLHFSSALLIIPARITINRPNGTQFRIGKAQRFDVLLFFVVGKLLGTSERSIATGYRLMLRRLRQLLLLLLWTVHGFVPILVLKFDGVLGAETSTWSGSIVSTIPILIVTTVITIKSIRLRSQLLRSLFPIETLILCAIETLVRLIKTITTTISTIKPIAAWCSIIIETFVCRSIVTFRLR